MYGGDEKEQALEEHYRHRRTRQERLSNPTPDGHPLKPWVKSLRQSSSSNSGRLVSPSGGGGAQDISPPKRVEGEPMGAMRKRWSSVPSRVKDDVRKDRERWQASGLAGGSASAEFGVFDPSHSYNSPEQDGEEARRDFDASVVAQQCQVQAPHP